jgi:catechol 2,3-dioxygenase-like lactoylglutathione lyase family enzyme
MRNISHIAIGVRDIDEVLPFWTDVIGLKVDLDTIEEWPLNGEIFRRRGVYLRSEHGPDAPFIIIDQQLTHEPFGEPKQLFENGINHVGLWVDDIDEIIERAKAAGTPIVLGPTDQDSEAYGEEKGHTVRNVLFLDPERNVIQLDQRM